MSKCEDISEENNRCIHCGAKAGKVCLDNSNDFDIVSKFKFDSSREYKVKIGSITKMKFKIVLFLLLGLTLNAQITGKVTAKESYFYNGNIYTNNTIETDNGNLIIKTYGGIIGLQAETVSDTKQLQIGQRGTFYIDGQFLTRFVQNEISRVEITVSPNTVNGGIGEVVTITGADFGERNLVKFANANYGGAAVTPVDDSEIISWTNTEIKVKVPSSAGTGKVRVTLTDGTNLDSDPINVGYALINFQTGLPKLIDTNGSGGYSFQLADNIPNEARELILKGFDDWRCVSSHNYTISDETAPNTTTDDGINTIRFTNSGEFPTAFLGQCITRYSGCSNADGSINWYVKEIDLHFNIDLLWNYTDDISAGYHFESVSTHEIGHGVGLGHVVDNLKVMHYALATSTVRTDITDVEHQGSTYMANNSFSDEICNRPVMQPYQCQSLSNPDFTVEPLRLLHNPVKDILEFNIDIDGLEITNLLSQTLLNTKDVSSLEVGLYFAKVTYKNKTQTIKFVKQ